MCTQAVAAGFDLITSLLVRYYRRQLLRREFILKNQAAEELCVSVFCNRCSGPTGANDNHYCLVASVVVGSPPPQGRVGDTI